MRAYLKSLAVAAPALLLGLYGCTNPPSGSVESASMGNPMGAAAVTAERLINADNEPGSWLAAGRDYREQRFSPLDQINDTNVSKLGLAWYADIDTERGQESTPVVVDGVMYLTTAWSMVKAYDIRTGSQLWAYDPKIDRAKGADACCDVVNRGVAAWNGKIYVGVLDGRLIALDARPERWSGRSRPPTPRFLTPSPACRAS